MAWASLSNYLTLDIFIIYFAAIFWTLGYDTIYGAQDIVDDEIIGVKSTSIKFKSMLKKFVSINYLITIVSLILFFLNKSQSMIFLISGYFIKKIELKKLQKGKNQKCY